MTNRHTEHTHTDVKTKTQAQEQYCDKLKHEINTLKLKEMFEMVTSALDGDQTMKTRLSNFKQQGGHGVVYFLGADLDKLAMLSSMDA